MGGGFEGVAAMVGGQEGREGGGILVTFPSQATFRPAGRRRRSDSANGRGEMKRFFDEDVMSRR